MTNRERILSQVKTNQPEIVPLPQEFIIQESTDHTDNLVEHFKTVLIGIGGSVIELNDIDEINDYVQNTLKEKGRVISTLPELSLSTEIDWKNQDPHAYESVDLAIIRAHFGIAENAALWITEELMHQRVIPFICQRLAVVISASQILPSMHHAYNTIGNSDYGFGTFIAGPSKTADIEQSLVLGAHGPKNMVVFLLP